MLTEQPNVTLLADRFHLVLLLIEVILLRLRNAAEEDARMNEYQFSLVSADRESDYARFTALLTALGMRTTL